MKKGILILSLLVIISACGTSNESTKICTLNYESSGIEKIATLTYEGKEVSVIKYHETAVLSDQILNDTSQKELEESFMSFYKNDFTDNDGMDIKVKVDKKSKKVDIDVTFKLKEMSDKTLQEYNFDKDYKVKNIVKMYEDSLFTCKDEK